MRRDRIDRLFGRRRVGQIDAAEFEPVCGGRKLRRRVVDTGDPCAARQCLIGNHLAERA
jgi:hypothetical protein